MESEKIAARRRENYAIGDRRGRKSGLVTHSCFPQLCASACIQAIPIISAQDADDSVGWSGATICLRLRFLRAICQILSYQILSHSTWYKIRRSCHGVEPA